MWRKMQEKKTNSVGKKFGFPFVMVLLCCVFLEIPRGTKQALFESGVTYRETLAFPEQISSSQSPT